MTVEPTANLTRLHPQPRPWDEAHGSEVKGAGRQPRAAGIHPASDAETTRNVGRSRPVAKADAAPSRQEYPLYDAETEEAHWEAVHDDHPWADAGDFADFSTAYRTGYEGFNRLGTEYSFDDVEEELQEEYEAEDCSLPWEDAREAARAAWERLEGRTNEAHKDTGWPVP